jgi:hypothetical protein
MSETYTEALAAVCQLRELGAVRITVGPITAEFGHKPLVALDPLDPDEEHPLDVEEKAREDRREWARLQYFSAGGSR